MHTRHYYAVTLRSASLSDRIFILTAALARLSVEQHVNHHVTIIGPSLEKKGDLLRDQVRVDIACSRSTTSTPSFFEVPPKKPLTVAGRFDVSLCHSGTRRKRLKYQCYCALYPLSSRSSSHLWVIVNGLCLHCRTVRATTMQGQASSSDSWRIHEFVVMSEIS